MNWLKKLSSKDITLYHASPDNITELHPYSIMGFKPNRYKGMYFSENFQSLINDWIPYVMSKKLPYNSKQRETYVQNYKKKKNGTQTQNKKINHINSSISAKYLALNGSSKNLENYNTKHI